MAAGSSPPAVRGAAPAGRPVVLTLNIRLDTVRRALRVVGVASLALPGVALAARRLILGTAVDLLLWSLCTLACAVLAIAAVVCVLRGHLNVAYGTSLLAAAAAAAPFPEPRLVCVSLWLAAGVLRAAATALVFARWLTATRWTVADLPGRRQKIFRLSFARHVPKDSVEFQSIEAFVGDRCRAYAGKYPFSLKLVGLHKVMNPALESLFDGRTTESRTENVRQLFHGSTLRNTHGILCSGFRLPGKAGMFGAGIYFADCPLKSWQYCRDGRGAVLLCDVDLGNSRAETQATPKVSGTADLQPGWIAWLFGAETYDSVTAVAAEEGGSVRVPEYVVYSPGQAVPRYVLQLHRVGAAVTHGGSTPERPPPHSPPPCATDIAVALVVSAVPAVLLALVVVLP